MVIARGMKRTIVDESTDWAIKTTFIWVCYGGDWSSLSLLKWQTIWQIKKYIETTSGSDVDTDEYYAIDNNTWKITDDYIFEWDERLNYSYA